MKRIIPMMLAIVAAISFSAFTTIQKAPTGNYKYDDGTGMVDVPPEIDVDFVCPTGFLHDCIIEINGEDELIYLNGNVVKWQ